MTANQTDYPDTAVSRQDFLIDGEPGLQLFVRAVRATAAAQDDRVPILLLHGARVPGLASFDLAVPGGSLAADLALAGHPAYVMDARGYGGSTRPTQMSEPPEANPPLARSAEVARDIHAVVRWIGQRHTNRPLAALGWATGGQWLGYYATLYPERLSHLILFNALYGGSPDHPSIGRGSDLEDPQHPGRFNRAENGAYRYNSAASLMGGWNNSIPLADKSEWYDPAVAAAYQAAALASDPTSASREPASFRSPLGALEDSFYLASGRQLWDASLIRTRTLYLRSERDFWSRPADPDLFAARAAHAPEVRLVTLPDATHHVHLDRPERGRAHFLQEVLAFLSP
jgi:pimeloyl-ACP methyl ester carboxylesterase